ncbi:WD40 repeat-like protein [Xylariaceae sp. FL1272]|nr:WD40 repeat-like protein [Xylariaceae sp. FL1272]
MAPTAGQRAQRNSAPPERLKNAIPHMRPTIYHDPSIIPKSANKNNDDEENNNKNIRTLAWNPLGTWVATGCMDKTLRVWNIDKPNVRQTTELRGHAASIEKVAFNPVKELELCSVSLDGVVRFWDVKSKAVLNEVKGLGETFTLAWAPKGDCVVVGNKEDKLFVLSPTKSTPISSHQQSVETNNIIFDWAGERLFTTTCGGKTRILQFPSFEPAYQFDYKEGPDKEFMLAGHTSSCIAAELHPQSRFLATGGTDSLIALWDTIEWNCVRTVTKMRGPVRSLSFSWDGLFLIGGSDEGTGLEVTLSETGEHIGTIKTSSPAPVVAWAPNKYAIAYTDSGSLRTISASFK